LPAAKLTLGGVGAGYLAEKLGAAGVKVKPDMRGVPSKAFWFRRGLGLIHGTVGFCGDETLIYFGFGHPFNLLFWISDQRLLNFIQRVFISNGSAVVDLNTIAEPSTERSGRGGVGKKT